MSLFGPLWIQLAWDSQCLLDLYASFTKLGKFSFIIFSNKFWIVCSSSSASGTSVIWMLALLEMSESLLKLSSFFKFLCLHFVSIEYLFLPYAPNHWFESWFPSLHCWFLMDFSLFPLVEPFFFPYAFEMFEIFEHSDHQCFELCV